MDSAGLIQQTPLDLVRRNPLDKSDGIHWTSPMDSAGLIQQTPLEKSNGFRWTYPTDSTGIDVTEFKYKM